MSKYLAPTHARNAIYEIRQCIAGGGGDQWPGPVEAAAAHILVRAKSEEGIAVIISSDQREAALGGAGAKAALE